MQTWNRSPLHRIIALVVISTAVLVVYYGSFGGEFISDDVPMIRDNPHLQSPAFVAGAFRNSVWENSAVVSERKNLYRPAYLLWYYLIHSTAGKNPLWFHVANTMVHLCNALMVFLIIGRLLTTTIVQQTAGALIFALHPASTEAVAWISGGTDVLMVFLLLTSLLALMRSAGGANVLFLTLSILAYSAALLTK